MIDRYLLRYFLAVIDHGNFSKAAVQCNVSQPTLSVGIAKLERLLNERKPLYKSLADLRIKTAELTPQETAYGVMESARVFFAKMKR